MYFYFPLLFSQTHAYQIPHNNGTLVFNKKHICFTKPCEFFSTGKYKIPADKNAFIWNPVFADSIVNDTLNLNIESGNFRTIIPCAGSCNHASGYGFKAEFELNKSVVIIQYFDTISPSAHTYMFGLNGIMNKRLPVMSFYENGATVICDYTTDSGKWYGDFGMEQTIQQTYKIKSTDSLFAEVKFGNNLLYPPFYPGYKILPTGTWTFVSSQIPYHKYFYKISYELDSKTAQGKRIFKLKLTPLNGG